MTVDEFIAEIEDKQPPAPASTLGAFEGAIGCTLPDDYRAFVVACNGGYLGGALRFRLSAPDDRPKFSSVHHIGGFRDESYLSLEHAREVYDGRIPRNLIWIMDDPGGNAICLGVDSKHRGSVYFWSHAFEPDEEEWDGAVESAPNVRRIASSFTEFVAGLQRPEPDGQLKPAAKSRKRWWNLW